MPGFVVNTRGLGKPIAESDYPVVLVKASSKTTANGKNMLSLQANIKGDSEFSGRPLFRNFVFDPASDADNSGSAYYMMEALVAFGADPDDFDTDAFDAEDYAKSLYGNSAMAKVTHRTNEKDPSRPMLDVKFYSDEM